MGTLHISLFSMIVMHHWFFVTTVYTAPLTLYLLKHTLSHWPVVIYCSERGGWTIMEITSKRSAVKGWCIPMLRVCFESVRCLLGLGSPALFLVHSRSWLQCEMAALGAGWVRQGGSDYIPLTRACVDKHCVRKSCVWNAIAEYTLQCCHLFGLVSACCVVLWVERTSHYKRVFLTNCGLHLRWCVLCNSGFMQCINQVRGLYSMLPISFALFNFSC